MQLEEKKEKEENLEKNQNSYYKLKSYLIMNLIQRKIMAFGDTYLKTTMTLMKKVLLGLFHL